MRKIIIIILIVLSFGVSSCKYNGNNNDGTHEHEFVEGVCSCGEKDSNYDNSNEEPEANYTFIEREDIEKALSIYSANVELDNADGTKNSFVISENNNYFYYSFKDTKLLIDKNDESLYTIDDTLKVKTLEKQLKFDKEANKNVLFDLLAGHIDSVDNKFKKTENIKVGNFDCDLYEKIITIDSLNYAKYYYYVDKLTGYCVKSHLETCMSGQKTTSSWEFKSLIFDEDVVNNFINPMLEYSTEVAPLEFSKWPNEGLALLIPEYQSGEFSFGIDYGNKAVLSIEGTRLSHVKDYASTLKEHGFAEGKGATNEASQYVFITYNSDNIMVKIVFTATVSNLTITISQSTQEEINKELSKL